VGDRTIIVHGKWLRIASVQDEELVQGEVVDNPEKFIAALRNGAVKADLFTFAQRISATEQEYPYQFEWDNVAAASTERFADWWDSLPQESRKNVRRAAKRGLAVRIAQFDDEFIKGIQGIYNETPVRQGRRFWHYQKDLETVKMENQTYLERSQFIGAYYNEELIGFTKFVYVDRLARILQIVSKTSHSDKRPMNALIAKAVEVCQDNKISYLIYSKFSFGNKKVSPLAEFKSRNGFKQKDFIRYYVPLTVRGKIALKLKLHRGLLGILPAGLINFLLKLRSWFFAR
ncbi:MAG: hypothetical protein ABJB34_01440, partial [Acidobacteriota bacterium]